MTFQSPGGNPRILYPRTYISSGFKSTFQRTCQRGRKFCKELRLVYTLRFSTNTQQGPCCRAFFWMKTFVNMNHSREYPRWEIVAVTSYILYVAKIEETFRKYVTRSTWIVDPSEHSSKLNWLRSILLCCDVTHLFALIGCNAGACDI